MASFELKIITRAWEAWDQQGEKKTEVARKRISFLASWICSAFKYSEIIWGKLPNSGYKEILKCVWILKHYKGILGQFPGAQCNCGGFLLILCRSCKIITWGKEWCYLVFISPSVSALRDYPEKFSRTFLTSLYFNCCIKKIFPLTLLFFFQTFKENGFQVQGSVMIPHLFPAP